MPQQHTSSPDQGERFDWWAVRPTGPDGAVPTHRHVPPPQHHPAQPQAVGQPQGAGAAASPVAAAPSAPAPAGRVAASRVEPAAPDAAEVYRAVQESAAFQEIRRSYRAFAFPAVGAFLGWYLLYVGAQATAPALMRSQVAGPLNVAWVLGLLQFVSTFLLTWLYARNARTQRDRAALELRWTTQDRLR